MKLEQQPQFSVGEFVRMKGQKDSPIMIVERNHVSRFYSEYSNSPKTYDVLCSWWNAKKNKFESEKFEETILEKVEENPTNQ
jgi:uncharacterized protein YodC (DUF2158 family)